MPQIVTNIRYATNIEELKRNLQSGIDTLDVMKKSVDRTVQVLGGTGLLAAANKTAAAIQELGGVTKLTAAEQERANALIQKALDKYQALGLTAPTALRQLAAATKQTTTATDLLSSTFGQMFAAFSAASLVNRAVGTLVDFGREALTTAGTLVDLSNKTGLSTETIQRMQFVAKQSGSDMSAFADATFKMGVNIAEGTKKARDGAESLGLSWKDLRAASPDAQFNMVVQALERMEDPQKRNEAAVALFGKTAKEILPAIVDGYTKVAKEATVAGDAQVHALDAAGDAWDRWKQRTTTGFINVLGSMALLREASDGLTDDEKAFVLQTMQGEKSIEAYDAALIRFYLAKQKAKDVSLVSDKPLVPASFAADLKAAEAGWAALTASEREEVFTALQLGKSHDDIINKLNITEEVLAVGKKAYEAHQEAVRKAGSEAEKFSNSLAKLNTIGASTDATIASLDGTVVEGLKYYLAQGASVEDLARVYGLLAPQVDAVKRAMTEEKELLATLAILRNFTAKKAVEANAEANKTQVAQMQAFNAQIVGNLGIQTKARLEAKDLRLKATTDEFTYQQVKLSEWVANEKAKVNLNADNWQAAYAAIDADAQERFAELVRIHNDALAQMEAEEHSWKNILIGTFADIPKLLQAAFTGGGGVEGALKAMTSGLGASIGKKLFEAGGALNSLGNTLTAGMTKIFGKSVGNAFGLALPEIGAAVGAFAGSLLDMIVQALSRPEWMQQMRDVGRDWGVQISQGLAQQLQKIEETQGIGRVEAQLVAMRDIISEAGGLAGTNIGPLMALNRVFNGFGTAVANYLQMKGLVTRETNFETYIKKLQDVFVALQTHTLTTAQATKILDDNFQDFVIAGTNRLGMLDQRLIEIIKRNDEFGTHSKAIAEYLKSQADAALTGFAAIVDGTEDVSKGYDEIKKAVDDATAAQKTALAAGDTRGAQQAARDLAAAVDRQRLAADGTKESLDDLGTIALATFSGAIASGMSFADALKTAGPALSRLSQDYQDLGLDIDNAALKSLLMQNTILSGNPKLAAGVSGLSQSFVALYNSGLLTVDTFAAMERTGYGMYVRLQAETAKAGGTSRDALLPIQQYLHQAEDAAKKYGYALDQNTQMMIGQSKEFGIWQDEDPTDTLIGGMKELIKAVKELGDKLTGLPKKIDTDIMVNTHYTTEGTPEPINSVSRAAATGGLVTALGIQHFDLGGIVKASGWRTPWTFAAMGTDTIPAMLTPGELILNEPQQAKIADLLAAGAAAAQGLLAAGKSGPAVVLQEKFEFSFSLQTIDGSDLQQTVETKLMPQIVSVIEDRRRGYTARLQQALGTT